MRTSPEGYLVFQQEISLPMPRGCRGGDGRSVCYYLPRHPFDWAEDCEENSAYNQDVLQAQDRSGYPHSATSPHSIDHSFTSNSSVNSSAHKHPHSSRGDTYYGQCRCYPNVENLTFGEYICHGDDSRTHERGSYPPSSQLGRLRASDQCTQHWWRTGCIACERNDALTASSRRP